MTITRFYTRDGMPAYVEVTQTALDGVSTGRRLIYAGAFGFGALWEKGTDAPTTQVDLS